MEVIEATSQVLTNYQVYEFLKEKKTEFDGKKNKAPFAKAATVTLETIAYLENTPAKLQSEDILIELAERLSKFNLTKSEELLLLNHRPTGAVEIQLMIEDSEERLTDTQVQEILKILHEVLPTDKEEDEDEQPEEDDDEAMENGDMEGEVADQ